MPSLPRRAPQYPSHIAAWDAAPATEGKKGRKGTEEGKEGYGRQQWQPSGKCIVANSLVIGFLAAGTFSLNRARSLASLERNRVRGQKPYYKCICHYAFATGLPLYGSQNAAYECICHWDSSAPALNAWALRPWDPGGGGAPGLPGPRAGPRGEVRTGKSRAAESKPRPSGQHHELPLVRAACFQPPEESCGVDLRTPSVPCPGMSAGADTHVGSSRWSTLCATPWFAPSHQSPLPSLTAVLPGRPQEDGEQRGAQAPR